MSAPRPLGRWRSRTTFVLALSASAVGLGNLWRFSYLVGENGGAPFVVAYLICLFAIAVPVLIAEVVVGKQARSSPVLAMRHAADRSLRSRGWAVAGVVACLAALLILPYYSVVAGWSLSYALSMQAGEFAAASGIMVGESFQQFLADSSEQIKWHSAFLLVVLLVVSLGVRRGLGLMVWLAVPALMALLGVLVKFSMDHGDVAAAQAFLFGLQPLDFTAQSWLVALGHAFYTLGVGVGIGVSYGAYAPERIPVGRSVLAVAVFDTLIALFAGLAIFPIVFANNIEPSMGPGLLFVSVPYAFGNIAAGELFGALFFLLVVIAALGSAVALLEPVVGTLKQYFRLRRFTATVIAGAAVWVLGVGVALSFGGGQDAGVLAGFNLFDLLDRASSLVLLPLSALLLSLFVGWRIQPVLLRFVLDRESGVFFSLWYFLLRYIVPPAIITLFVSTVALA